MIGVERLVEAPLPFHHSAVLGEQLGWVDVLQQLGHFQPAILWINN
jgi:hypothetical protein